MNINLEDYRNKVLGCWMGKNIGGTLGAPMEWRRQVNDVSFYTQDLGGEPLPNDDLDIQLLWLVALEEKGLDLNAHLLSEYWTLYVTPHWSEYGTAKVNMRTGLMPPLSGTVNNAYKDSCGAFIRSEIWACIAPGNPRLAAKYAYEDAILDHGNGEGVYAEVFCAALESAAFVCSDIPQLIEIGLSYIPDDCGVARATREAVAAHRAGKTWLEARDLILEKYRGGTFFGMREMTSERDWKKGFGDGDRGWDVPDNIGMLIVGLLYGEGDFGKSICTAVNCGEDTDCTGATVGSIFGILHGVDSIPEEWIFPIGRKIKTACLNLGELGYFGNQLPRDVDSMTDRTIRIAQQVALRGGPLSLSSDMPTELADVSADGLKAGSFKDELYRNFGCPVFRFDFFEIGVDYDNDPTISAENSKTVRLRVRNTYKVQANLNVRWYAPEGWRILPSELGIVSSFPSHLGEVKEIAFQVQADAVREHVNRLAVEFTISGRTTVMLVPVILLHANLK